jgi:hypothetical protein
LAELCQERRGRDREEWTISQYRGNAPTGGTVKLIRLARPHDHTHSLTTKVNIPLTQHKS